MAKFKFPLDAVKRVRKVNEDLAQRDFGEAMSRLNKELEVLSSMEKQKSDAREARHGFEVQGGSKVPHMTQVHEFLVGQDVRIERQKKKIQYIETQVEELREILRQKALEHKMIVSLEDKRREEFKKSESQRQQKIADDMTSMRFAKNRGDDEDGL